MLLQGRVDLVKAPFYKL
ncbi:UNVERIFIED_CONTAM: hypothetical protein GTU68_029389 [Idotea baltica]|nr:hypothetical protein [Idotea baltica]